MKQNKAKGSDNSQTHNSFNGETKSTDQRNKYIVFTLRFTGYMRVYLKMIERLE